MGKSPGFWFFTGDWMKDSELRFCSIFARGLLVDLLCLMFEAKQMGYMSKPDGSPRSDEDIVNAVSGATTAEKLSGLRELEQSGVLSRDLNGVLFSRRLARLAEISKERSKAGSKGGSKSKAKPKQNDKQKRGVTDSDSVSDSDSINTLSLPHVFEEPKFRNEWARWESHRLEKQKPLGSIEAESQIYDLVRFGVDEAIAIIQFSITRGALNLLTNGDHRKKPTESNGNGRKRHSLEEMRLSDDIP